MAWKNEKLPDSSRIEAGMAYATGPLLRHSPDSSLKILTKIYVSAESIKDSSTMARTSHSIGVAHFYLSEYIEAINYMRESLALRKELGANDASLGPSINVIGAAYIKLGDYSAAIESFSQSLVISELNEDSSRVASALNNIGLVYGYQKNYQKALEYHHKSRGIKSALNNLKGVASSENNIGLVYEKMKQPKKALEHYQKSYDIRTEINDSLGMGLTLNNIGIVLVEQREWDKAQEYFEKSLEIKKRVKDKEGIGKSIFSLADLEYQRGNVSLAMEKGLHALKIAREIENAQSIKDASGLLYKCYKKIGKPQLALDMYELHISTKDTLSSRDAEKEVINQEYKRKYLIQAATDSIRNEETKKLKEAELLAERQQRLAEKKEHDLERKREKQQAYFLYAMLGMALLFGVFIFQRFRVSQKQRAVIEKQKEQVDSAYDQLEEKNTEILDSINYAKRIQTAILPPDRLVKQYLADSFILYKPKDIVAGDFYWMEPQKDRILFAAADCTGHGVPGAMVSVVCNNGLNRATREFGLTDPGQILDKTRELVIAEFEKSEEEVKDGMDIALCSLEQSSLEGNTLKYAGANNPLWIIRKGTSEIEEIKANKQPIGKYADPKPYTTHSVELQKGDTVYIFSDGYADQFGGDKGKKFKAANFKKLLLSIQNETIERQKELIDQAFEDWKDAGGQPIEQLDDVCVIGLRI